MRLNLQQKVIKKERKVMCKEEEKRERKKRPIILFITLWVRHGNSLVSLIKININDLPGFADQLLLLNSTNLLIKFNLNEKIVKVQLQSYVT